MLCGKVPARPSLLHLANQNKNHFERNRPAHQHDLDNLPKTCSIRPSSLRKTGPPRKLRANKLLCWPSLIDCRRIGGRRKEEAGGETSYVVQVGFLIFLIFFADVAILYIVQARFWSDQILFFCCFTLQILRPDHFKMLMLFMRQMFVNPMMDIWQQKLCIFPSEWLLHVDRASLPPGFLMMLFMW